MSRYDQQQGPGIGATLKDARRRMGMDIKEAEDRTKIRTRYLRALEAEPDVARHGQVGEERPFLRHHAHPAQLGWCAAFAVGDRRPPDRDRAAVGTFEPGDDAEQRRLAAAGGTEDGGDAADRHDQVDAVQHQGAAEGLGDSSDLERRHRRYRGHLRRRRSVAVSHVRTPSFGRCSRC